MLTLGVHYEPLNNSWIVDSPLFSYKRLCTVAFGIRSMCRELIVNLISKRIVFFQYPSMFFYSNIVKNTYQIKQHCWPCKVKVTISMLTFLYCFNCLSNREFDRLVGPLDEIVTVSVHKYSVIMPRPNMTSWRHFLSRRWLLHLKIKADKVVSHIYFGSKYHVKSKFA